MSFNRFVISGLFSTVLFAQAAPDFHEGSFSGEIESNGSTALNTLFVELYNPRNHEVVERTSVAGDGSFRFSHGADSSYTVRVVTAPGEDPLVEESGALNAGNSLVLRLPDQKTNRPGSGTVSLRQLQNPIPKKAMNAAIEAARYSDEHQTAKAIAKLEEAIHIAPNFRDAHTNLGVQYARAGRLPEALAQFHFALDIGPPTALIYSDLSLTLLTLKQFRDGEQFARKALALEPENASAQRLLRYAAAH